MKLFAFIFILFFMNPVPEGFKAEQRKNLRVKQAYKDKKERAGQLLKNFKITFDEIEIFIRVFKKEEVVELWARNKNDERFVHITDYKFCASSGSLGPKRKAGDNQTPEGFYTINGFNPNSNFYLSLQVSYPNQSDRIMSKSASPGGDIFIHGNCVTIGCIPITDDKIKELYLFAVEARNNGQMNIPVHIFPTRLTNENLMKLEETVQPEKSLLTFWKNLQEGFFFFENKKYLPVITVNNNGFYQFKNPVKT